MRNKECEYFFSCNFLSQHRYDVLCPVLLAFFILHCWCQQTGTHHRPLWLSLQETEWGCFKHRLSIVLTMSRPEPLLSSLFNISWSNAVLIALRHQGTILIAIYNIQIQSFLTPHIVYVMFHPVFDLIFSFRIGLILHKLPALWNVHGHWHWSGFAISCTLLEFKILLSLTCI